MTEAKKAISRRLFLMRGSMGAAAVGIAAAVPGVPALLSTNEAVAPAAEEDGAALEGEAVTMTESVVAHVKDLGTGEIRLFTGAREIVCHDTKLAAQLVKAAR